MEIILILTALSAFVGFALFVLALALNPRSPINRATGINGLLMGLWSLGACFLYFATTQEQAWFWYRTSSVGAFLNAPMMIWFFLCLSGVPFQKRLFLAFPFFLINLTMLVANSFFPVWYSGFRFTGHGAVGVPDNPTAWVAFAVVTGIYLWALIYFSAASGFGSKRLVWLSRSLRNVLLVSILLYVLCLFVEAIFLLPHLSVVAFSLTIYVWIHQIHRYGFLNPWFSAKSLDFLLAFRFPVAFVEPSGTLKAVNPAFAETFGLDERECPGLALEELFTDPSAIRGILRTLGEQKSEVTAGGLLPRSGAGTFDLILGPNFDEFGDLTGVVVQLQRQGQTQPQPGESLTDQLKRMELSARETHIAFLMSQGLSNKEIAAKAFIAPGTVRVHAYNIFQKTGTANRAELVRLLATARSDKEGLSTGVSESDHTVEETPLNSNKPSLG